MDAFINEYQYTIAWLVYLVAGLVFSAFWWKLTGVIRHSGWRDLFRGIALVVIFTPWYIGEAHVHVAPASMVVGMDLLLGSTDNGLAGALVLLVMTAIMLAVLIGKRLLHRSARETQRITPVEDGS